MRRRDFLSASIFLAGTSLPGLGLAMASSVAILPSLSGLHERWLVSAALARSPKRQGLIVPRNPAVATLPDDASIAFNVLMAFEPGVRLGALLDDRDAILLSIVVGQRGGLVLGEHREAPAKDIGFIFIDAQF